MESMTAEENGPSNPPKMGTRVRWGTREYEVIGVRGDRLWIVHVDKYGDKYASPHAKHVEILP